MKEMGEGPGACLQCPLWGTPRRLKWNNKVSSEVFLMHGGLCVSPQLPVCLSVWGKQKRLLFANLIPAGGGFPGTPGIPGCT